MPKSCRQRIEEATLARLQTVPAIETASGFQTVEWEMNRRTPLTEEEVRAGPRGILFSLTEIRLHLFASMDYYRLPFVAQLAIAGAGEEAAAIANALRAEVLKALFADETLTGLASALELVDTGDFIGVETPSPQTEGFMLGFHVDYATREGDPFTFE